MIQLKIDDQCFFNNGEFILPTLTDKAGTALGPCVQSWLTQAYTIPQQIRKKGSGIKASDLNKALKGSLNASVIGAHGETHIEQGAFFHRSINGFDFSLYDEQANLIRLWNEFVGDKGQFDGMDKLLALYSKAVCSKSDWEKRITALGGTPGHSIEAKKDCLTVVGELQFGNWALVKHDLLRLLNATNFIDIDYYIYIAATGTLLGMLSDGIVSYSSAIDAITDNIKLLKTPIWVIGLDCEVML